MHFSAGYFRDIKPAVSTRARPEGCSDATLVVEVGAGGSRHLARMASVRLPRTWTAPAPGLFAIKMTSCQSLAASSILSQNLLRCSRCAEPDSHFENMK